MIFDFHAHFTLKPFNSLTIYSQRDTPPDDEINRERFRPKENISVLTDAFAKELNTTSQLHMNSLSKSGIRGMAVALYPLERVFTKYKLIPNMLNFITSHIGLNEVIDNSALGPVSLRAVATITGLEVDKLKVLKAGGYHYFKGLKAEYDYLRNNQNTGNPQSHRLSYEIAFNYKELKRIIGEGKIAFIITVEGINAFYNLSGDFETYLKADKSGNGNRIVSDLKKNMEEFKANYPLFITTLAHHQYNFLCGHSESFINVPKLLLKQNGKTRSEKGRIQNFYEVGIRPWGYQIIELLLDKNSKYGRVLIDTKHMSRQARIDYHAYIKHLNANGDDIPIIQTHTAVNGRSFNEHRRYRNHLQELKKYRRKKIIFNTATINLFDEEILDIVESNGLMGIMLDEKRLLGKKLPDDTAILVSEMDIHSVSPDGPNRSTRDFLTNKWIPMNRFKYNKKLLKKARLRLLKKQRSLEEQNIAVKQRNTPSTSQYSMLTQEIASYKSAVDQYNNRQEYPELSILFNQFFHILKVCSESGEKAWYHICIGSDYDGAINPQDTFYYSGNLAGIEQKLIRFWKDMLHRKEEEFQSYQDFLFGKQPDFWVKRILWENADQFLSRYFTDGYRLPAIQNKSNTIQNTV